MKLSLCSIAIIAMCLFSACSSHSSNQKLADGLVTQDVTLANVKQEPKLSSSASDTATSSSGSTQNMTLQSGSQIFTDWDKKIIKTANVSLEVKDYKTFNNNIHNSIKSFGAYTAAEQQSASNTRIENTLTIKVPVDQFDNLINSIGGDGITVLSKNISTEDVSNELIDTKARVEAKKQLRDKYEELLKEAKTMKDILQVQAEINNLQEELEAAAGRVNFLTHSAAYSTVALHYFQYVNGNSEDSEQPTFFTNIKEAFTTGSSVFAHIFLFLISIWPLVLTGGLLYIYLKRGKAKKVSV